MFLGQYGFDERRVASLTLVELEATFAAIGRFLEKRTEALNGGSGASTNSGQSGRVRSARRNKKRK